MGQEHLVCILDEQVSVGFTGKINVQDSKSKQQLGSILFVEGEIIDCRYKSSNGLKAFFNLCVDEFDDIGLSYIVEPELIQISKKTIHYPYSVLKRKIAETVEKYRESRKSKPPRNLKILIEPSFLSSSELVTGNEFDLLGTISDYNKVGDIYDKSNLLEYEITNTLVSLRKKKALKVIQNKDAKG